MNYVLALSVTSRTYTLTDQYFVVDILDTNMILGVSWFIALGKVTTGWETLQMEWVDKKSGKHRMIGGMHIYPPQIDSAHKIEHDLRSESRDKSVHSCMQSTLDDDVSLHGEISPRRPPDQQMLRDASHFEAPFIDFIGVETLGGHYTALRVLGRLKEERVILSTSFLLTLISNYAL